MPRLIPGEYDAPAGRYAAYWGRVAFLDSVRLHAPAALSDLRGACADDCSAIVDWARRWHVDADWVMSAAALALAHWREFPASHADVGVWVSGVGASSPTAPGVPLTYDPFTETRAAFRKRLSDYEHFLEASGCARVGPKTSPEHFAWTARYQVCGATIASLAAEAGTVRQAVKPAMLRVSKLIGLKLRPSKPGRPVRKR